MDGLIVWLQIGWLLVLDALGGYGGLAAFLLLVAIVTAGVACVARRIARSVSGMRRMRQESERIRLLTEEGDREEEWDPEQIAEEVDQWLRSIYREEMSE
jgi:hypothetical protein